MSEINPASVRLNLNRKSVLGRFDFDAFHIWLTLKIVVVEC